MTQLSQEELEKIYEIMAAHDIWSIERWENDSPPVLVVRDDDGTSDIYEAGIEEKQP